MSETRASMDLFLPTVGPGPSSLALSDLAKFDDCVLLLHQRDHSCTDRRNQVQDLGDSLP